MTNTYLIHAWCGRPFITYLDPVEAETPEEARGLLSGSIPVEIDEAAGTITYEA